MNKIFNDIQTELDYQNQKWGSEFDHKNTPNDWMAYIVAYTGMALTLPWNPKQFRTAMVKVAALAISAIHNCDKAGGDMPKRHYD